MIMISHTATLLKRLWTQALKGNCDSSDSFLDFTCRFLYSFICSANVGCSPTPRQHFWKIVGSKNFSIACGSIPAANLNHKKEDSRPFLRIGYLLLRMFVLHQKHREWTFRTISPTEAYFPGISPKISMAEKTFDTILFHSAKPLLTASHQSVLAFQFQPAVLDGSVP